MRQIRDVVVICKSRSASEERLRFRENSVNSYPRTPFLKLRVADHSTSRRNVYVVRILHERCFAYLHTSMSMPMG